MLLIFFWHPITALALYWKNEKFHCSLKTLNGHSRNQQISNVADSFSGIPEYSRKMTYLRFTRILRLTLSSDAWGKTFCVEIYVTKNTFESGRCFEKTLKNIGWKESKTGVKLCEILLKTWILFFGNWLLQTLPYIIYKIML